MKPSDPNPRPISLITPAADPNGNALETPSENNKISRLLLKLFNYRCFSISTAFATKPIIYDNIIRRVRSVPSYKNTSNSQTPITPPREHLKINRIKRAFGNNRHRTPGRISRERSLNYRALKRTVI